MRGEGPGSDRHRAREGDGVAVQRLEVREPHDRATPSRQLAGADAVKHDEHDVPELWRMRPGHECPTTTGFSAVGDFKLPCDAQRHPRYGTSGFPPPRGLRIHSG